MELRKNQILGCTPGCTTFSAKQSRKKQKCGLFRGFDALDCSRLEGQRSVGVSRRGATWFCLRFAWPLANGLLEFCLSKTWIPAITTTPQAWGPSPRVDSLVGRGIGPEMQQSCFLLSTGGRPVESSKADRVLWGWIGKDIPDKPCSFPRFPPPWFFGKEWV